MCKNLMQIDRRVALNVLDSVFLNNPYVDSGCQLLAIGVLGELKLLGDGDDAQSMKEEAFHDMPQEEVADAENDSAVLYYHMYIQVVHDLVGDRYNRYLIPKADFIRLYINFTKANPWYALQPVIQCHLDRQLAAIKLPGQITIQEVSYILKTLILTVRERCTSKSIGGIPRQMLETPFHIHLTSQFLCPSYRKHYHHDTGKKLYLNKLLAILKVLVSSGMLVKTAIGSVGGVTRTEYKITGKAIAARGSLAQVNVEPNVDSGKDRIGQTI